MKVTETTLWYVLMVFENIGARRVISTQCVDRQRDLFLHEKRYNTLKLAALVRTCRIGKNLPAWNLWTIFLSWKIATVTAGKDYQETYCVGFGNNAHWRIKLLLFTLRWQFCWLTFVGWVLPRTLVSKELNKHLYLMTKINVWSSGEVRLVRGNNKILSSCCDDKTKALIHF